MRHDSSRRQFLQQSAQLVAGLGLAGGMSQAAWADDAALFQISLAQWSLHRAFFDKKLNNLDFAKTAKMEFGIDAIEYVNQFFKDKAKDQAYLADMKQRAADLG